MSQNLENIFKDSLQDLDAPYNPKAWEALQTRLDAAMPTVAPKKVFKPWKTSAAVVGLVGISAALYFLNSASNEAENSSVAIEKTKIDNPNSTSSITSPVSESAVVAEKNIDNPTKNSSAKLETKAELSGKTNPSNNTSKTANKNAENVIVEKMNTQNSQRFETQNTGISSIGNLAPIVLPVIEKQCLNETIRISNTNSIPLTVTYPSGKKKDIPSKKESMLELTESGMYIIADANNTKENSFLVNSAMDPFFEIDLDNIYKNGLPSTFVKSNSIANEFKWSCNKSNDVLLGKEAEFHFFKQGDYTIELEIVDQNGCKARTSRKVRIENDYNLLAVDAFNPLHNDSRRNTFIPFALKERNTGFSMVIIDPKDGGLVYQTSDANAGWDGTDKRTGNQAISGSSYIWKVVLKNPLASEADNYKGVVIVTK